MELRLVTREPPVARRVVDQILAGIREGRYPVGSLLPSEQDIGLLCGVSRPSVREALSALQFAGYVETRRGAGTVVARAEPEAERADDAVQGVGVDVLLARLEARIVVEPEVLALAAADPDPAGLDAASELVAGMDVAVADPGLGARTDRRVHAAILMSCRNLVLRDQALRLLDVATHPHFLAARERAWAEGTLPVRWARHHRRIVEAVAAGDPLGAAAAAREHLTSVATNLRDHGQLRASERRALTTILERARRRAGAAVARPASALAFDPGPRPTAAADPRRAGRGGGRA